MRKASSISQLDYSFDIRHALIGGQMFFVAFGALVLVPLLTGMSANVAMFTAGLGTLIFQVITRGRVPIFLASSFAFIVPIQVGIKQWGLPGTLCGLVAAGTLYCVLGLLVRRYGIGVIHRFLPPIVTGPVIMVIGLSLAPVAVTMATSVDTPTGVVLQFHDAMIISMTALLATVTVSLLGRGMLKLIPILSGILAGYAVAYWYGIIDFTPVRTSPWFAMPEFVLPEWNLDAIYYIVPVVIAPIIEHVGNIAAISAITGRDYMRDPGLDKTLIGDCAATMAASFLGGPPCTTYSEVSGGIALTKAYNPGVLTWAAISAICLAFIAKLGAVLLTIPPQVMGGIMILLFGAIIVVGINSLVQAKEDLMHPRNMAIIAMVLVFGLGGMEFHAGAFTAKDIGLAGLTGLVLHLILPMPKNT